MKKTCQAVFFCVSDRRQGERTPTWNWNVLKLKKSQQFQC